MNEIKEIMLSSGFSDAGICSFEEALPLLEQRNEKVNTGNKSVICGIVPYFTKERENQNISCYAVSRDYHLVLSEYMNTAIKTLKQIYENYSFAGFCDNSPINEVKTAALCGLGIIGKNNLLISKKYGSFVNICTILTDMPHKYDPKPVEGCENCGKCIASCPGKALSGESFQKERCLSFITQKKGELTEDEQLLIKKSGYIWGCDVCQRVCPHNKELKEQISNYPQIFSLSGDEINSLSNKAFKEKYKAFAFSWRGKAPLLRNILIED